MRKENDVFDFLGDRSEMSKVYVESANNYLKNKFPCICESFLWKVLQEEKGHLSMTYNKIKLMQNSPVDRVLFQGSFLQKPRNPHPQVQYIHRDERFEREMRFIEYMEEEEKKQRAECFLRKRNLQMRKAKGLEIKKCFGCEGEFDPAECIKCPDNHAFCKKCVKTNIERALSMGVPICYCLNTDICKKEFDDTQLLKVFSQSYVTNIHRQRHLFEVKKVLKDEYISCRACGWSSYIHKESLDKIGVFPCMNRQCLKTWCTHCWEASHGVEMCPKLVEEERRRKEEEDRQRKQALLLEVFPPALGQISADTQLTVLPADDVNYIFVSNFYANTQGRGRIKAIFAVARGGDAGDGRFAPYAEQQPRFLVWHGTGAQTAVPILNTGLLCNCGGCCYFAGFASMSNSYAQSRSSIPTPFYFMFVVEIFDARVSRGAQPFPMGTVERAVGATMPGVYYLGNTEYQVRRVEHARIRYLLIYSLQ